MDSEFANRIFYRLRAVSSSFSSLTNLKPAKNYLKRIALWLQRLFRLTAKNVVRLMPEAECLDIRFDRPFPGPEFVPKNTTAISSEYKFKVAAFYLPQFHPTIENNQAWGKNFTEWTNVVRAKPAFDGHAVPRVPLELGYYDLREKHILSAQVELAKNYGISAFIFHYYYFDGKAILETPVRRFLADTELDLEFCLCWANENWSKRWDGQYKEIIVRQNYDETELEKFIDYIYPYLKDFRYLKINGRPVLIIYRIDLFTDSLRTVRQFRQRARDMGLGELYIISTQTKTHHDPKIFGCDATMQFTPNNSAPDVIDNFPGETANFKGNLFDWSSLDRYITSDYDYPVYRTVCPGWDNSPRRREQANIFYGNSPQLFAKHLKSAAAINQKIADATENIVFVNAWNEWAEGAYLEPDWDKGYAYLQSIRSVVTGEEYEPTVQELTSNQNNTALIIHVFYLDVVDQIIDKIKNINEKIKLFISTTPDNLEVVEKRFQVLKLDYEIFSNPNRGRDILPFLRLTRIAIGQGYRYFLKIHSKKSTHRQDGAVWRDQLFDDLLSPQAFSSSLNAMATNSSIGLIGSQKHFIGLSTYWGSNKRAVKRLSQLLGISFEDEHRYGFFAGTMFFFTAEAVFPLLALRLNFFDFEPEEGQLDGTLAHAIERMFTFSCLAAGKELKVIDGLDLINAETLSKDYNFARKRQIPGRF